MRGKIATWVENAKTFHHRIMMRYLRRRGWIVFYLEGEARSCNDMCWIKLYKDMRIKDD